MDAEQEQQASSNNSNVDVVEDPNNQQSAANTTATATATETETETAPVDAENNATPTLTLMDLNSAILSLQSMNPSLNLSSQEAHRIYVHVCNEDMQKAIQYLLDQSQNENENTNTNASTNTNTNNDNNDGGQETHANTNANANANANVDTKEAADDDTTVATTTTTKAPSTATATDTATVASATSVNFPVSVFVRMRPLVGAEITDSHECVQYKRTTVKAKKKTKKKNKKKARRDSQSQSLTLKNSAGKNNSRDRKYTGFEAVLLPECNNVQTFEAAILPSIDNMFLGLSTCAFAYGHTGSGKTHTIFGYESEHGMYRLFAKELCARVAALDNDTLIEIRFLELYKSAIRDLLSADQKRECFLREDAKGNVHIRGQTVKYDDGRVVVDPISAVHATTEAAIVECILAGVGGRNVGHSTLHDKSSRSHAFLEFEIVTQALIDARIALPNKEAEHDAFKRKYDVVRRGVSGNKASLPKMEKKMAKIKARIKALTKTIRQALGDAAQPYIGGTFVFVDLAGNEFGKDVKMPAASTNTNTSADADVDADVDDSKNESERKSNNDKNNINTKASMEAFKKQEKERNEINKSLFALKECIRGLHNNKKRVPFRSSKLTMYLRKYLIGDQSKAIMITNIGPSKNYTKQTVNTLQYCQLIANA